MRPGAAWSTNRPYALPFDGASSSTGGRGSSSCSMSHTCSPQTRAPFGCRRGIPPKKDCSNRQSLGSSNDVRYALTCSTILYAGSFAETSSVVVRIASRYASSVPRSDPPCGDGSRQPPRRRPPESARHRCSGSSSERERECRRPLWGGRWRRRSPPYRTRPLARKTSSQTQPARFGARRPSCSRDTHTASRARQLIRSRDQ